MKQGGQTVNENYTMAPIEPDAVSAPTEHQPTEAPIAVTTEVCVEASSDAPIDAVTPETTDEKAFTDQRFARYSAKTGLIESDEEVLEREARDHMLEEADDTIVTETTPPEPATQPQFDPIDSICGKRACMAFASVDSLYGPPEVPDSTEADHEYAAGEGVNLIRRVFFVMSSDLLDYLIECASLDDKPSKMKDKDKLKIRKELDALHCDAVLSGSTLGGIEILECSHRGCGSETTISCLFIEKSHLERHTR
jgi:hypothetical protein